jgi:tetratricopeptide (TPR) repeat protein
MSHLGREAVRRILDGEGGSQEVEAAAEHLVSCDPCRALAGTVADELRPETPGLAGDGPLQLVLDLIDRERQWAVDYMAASAEWNELRRLPNRRSQRDRVRMAKACHTTLFFDLVLGDLKEAPAWEEAEFLAGLALLCVEAMSQRQRISPAADHDLKAKVWTAVANARRRAAEWEKAHQALSNAEKHRKEGTGDPLLEAELLSISASTLANEGHIARAIEALKRCRAIYRTHSEWALLARALVQTASLVINSEPAQALEALDTAAPLLPPSDPRLALLAGLLRVECLLGLSRPHEAAQVFRRCLRSLRVPGVRMEIRVTFTGAKLLDALGYKMPAERLYDGVVEREIEHELYKEAFLDLLYLYSRHVKAGEIEKAARVCRRALTDASLSAVAHDQMRTVWEQLLAATAIPGRRAVGPEVLSDLQRYLSVHWKHPAATVPVVGFR